MGLAGTVPSCSSLNCWGLVRTAASFGAHQNSWWCAPAPWIVARLLLEWCAFAWRFCDVKRCYGNLSPRKLGTVPAKGPFYKGFVRYAAFGHVCVAEGVAQNADDIHKGHKNNIIGTDVVMVGTGMRCGGKII